MSDNDAGAGHERNAVVYYRGRKYERRVDDIDAVSGYVVAGTAWIQGACRLVARCHGENEWHHIGATEAVGLICGTRPTVLTPDSESTPQKNTPDRTQPAEG